MKIEQLINDIILDDKKAKKILDFLKLYKVENYIYPNIFVNRCKISLKESYDIMSILRENGYVKPVFALYCFKCQKFVTGPYDSMNEIPEDIECDFCDETLNISDNIVTYYEVIKQLEENND